MQSRKSSILKPRKVREPLQDLNQLLPNNDDDETTTTDIQRRRVSFASMNKVKEYETAPECVAAINAPPTYDKRFSMSTDLYQPPIPGKNPNETYQTTTVSRKSIQNTVKVSTARLSVPDENIYVEDVELTETIGRIYDIPMKSSGDSSMEMTHVITQTDIQYGGRRDDSEVLGPLNMTKENLNQTGSFADAHIVEIEILKNEKDADTSSMETTEVLTNNVIRFENPDCGTQSMETTEVITNNIIRVEKPESSACSMDMTEVISPNFDKTEDDSSMETTDVICDNMLSESLKSQSVFFETMQSSQAFDETTSRNADVEYISVRDFESPSALPKRKSIFEMSTRPSLNWESTQMSTAHRENSNVSMKMVACNNSKLAMGNDSLSLTCLGMANRIDDSLTDAQMLSEEIEERLNISNEPQPSIKIVEEINFSTGMIRTSTQNTDKTKYDALSMQLLSQETEKNKSLSSVSLVSEKTKCNNSNMELLTQENKTKCNNSNMELLTQEDNKTKYNNSNMELLSQEENKTKYPNSNMELVSQEDNKTKYNNSNMELLTQEEKSHKSAAKLSVVENTKDLDDSVPAPYVEEKSCHLNTSALTLHNKTEIAEKSCTNLNLPEIATPVKPDLSECSTGLPNLSKIIPPEVDDFTEVESMSERVENAEEADPKTQPLPTSTMDTNDVPHDTTLKSSQGDDSSANDSNSPLTVGVNFSIFQKNKETRVEFSGTIDSNKKKKSISNVKVNIINNKTAKSNKHVKELRFSMPATSKSKRESEIHKPEFSATFTDFSVPNEDFSSALDKTETAAVEENHAEKVDECPLPVEATGPVASNLSLVPNDDMSSTLSAKPAKKRLSNDAFYDAEESEVCAKRRSLSNDANDSVRVPETASPAGTESSGSTASLVRRSITEIKQRKESFVREEKSILAIDDMVVETCSRSTNMNISYETRQLVSVAQHESFVEQNGSTAGQNGSIVEQNRSVSEQNRSILEHNRSIAEQNRSIAEKNRSIAEDNGSTAEQSNNPTSSEDSSSVADTKATVDSEEMAAANASHVEFSDADSGSRSHSLNQSSSQEETNDYSMHNPSIIVNVGDSFSHYKSMDLGTDNISASDIRESVSDENEPKPMADYIDSDDISKENFVVEWLQNKTGKTNAETRLFTSSSDNSSLATVKSMIRGSEKSSSTVISDTIHTMSREGSQKTSPEMSTDLVETDEKCKDISVKEVEESQHTSSEEESLPTGSEIVEPSIPEQTAFAVPQTEQMHVDDDVKPIPKPSNEENAPSEQAVTVEMSVQEELTTKSDLAPSAPVVSSPDVSASLNDDSNRMELSDENDSMPNLIDHEPEPDICIHTPVISCTDEKPKSTSKTRLSVDPVFVSSESTSEKRQKMSPEYERIETEQIFEPCTTQPVKVETEPVVENTVPMSEADPANERSRKQNQAMQPRNVFNVVDENQCESKVAKKTDKSQRHRKFAQTREDILEKIKASNTNANQKWKLKVASKDEWVFQFFFDQLELRIKFDSDDNSNTCSAVCEYVQPSYIKYYEICKIAVEYLIRKNDSKLKKICQTVEDVPYLLKLIEPDITYIEDFVADVIRLSESEIFKIKNGRAVFYIYSFKNTMSAKIQMNISRLERLSVKDIQVEEIVGKADINLVRSTFSEVGRGSDFVSKFVKKLWIVLDE